MEIIILIFIAFIIFSIQKSKTKKNDVDPFLLQVESECTEFLEKIDEYRNDYFNYSKKVILLNTYRITYENAKRVYKKISRKNLGANLIKFLEIYPNLNELITSWNDDYVKNELKSNYEYFSDIDGKSLDLQQRQAVVVDEDNNLVIAGAGSGKTLTIAAKVKYLIEKKNINPNKILLISFTGKAADEMKERINERLNISAEVRTFHSLGFSIINQSKSKKPDVYENIDKVINDYFNNEVVNNKKSISKLINFFGYYLNIPVDLEKYENLGEVFDNTKNLDLETIKSKIRRRQEYLRQNKVTLKSETVRSLEEVAIANYLYLNGINYEYEKVYPYDDEKNNRKLYRPDFYLPDYDIYIEHFGITRDYKTPWLSEIESEKYIKSIYWKRDIHKANGTLLLETYSYMNKEGILLSDLKKMLIENNVIFKPLDNYEVYTNLFVNNNDKYIGEFKKLIKTFLGLFKSNGYTSKNFNDLRELILKNDSAFLKQRALGFMDIMEPLFDYYTNYLEINRKIDFNDMINMATDIVKGKSVSLDYDYIIIDEYQDISMSRFNLIKEIKNQTNAKVIAVGDDWQSIYRFAGSDINLFTDFEKYFGVTEVLKIEKTYRNSQELVNIASRFVMQNNRQIKKKLISDKHNSNPVRILGYEFNVIEAFRKAIDEIVYLNGEEAEILLLGRNNFDVRLFRETKIVEDEDEDKNKDEDDEDLTDTFKPIETDSISIKKHNREYKIVYKKYPKLKINYLTVHRSKGLEADNVIILNLTNNIFGFPNRLTDDPILSLVITDLDDFDYAEERRLFYVAITRTKNVTYLLAPQFNQSVFTDELIRKQNIVFDTSLINEPKIDNPNCPVCEKGILILRENSITNNKFLGCTNYPLCNNTFKEIEILNNQIACNVCGGYMVRRKGKYGKFYGCTNYPDCRNTIRIEKDLTETNYETPNKEVAQDGLSAVNFNLNKANNKVDNSINSRKDDKKSNTENIPKPKESFTNTISNQIEGEYHRLDKVKDKKNKKSKNIREKKKRTAFDIGTEVQHNAFGVGTVLNNDTKIITVLFEDEKLVKLSLETCINSNLLIELNNVSESTIDSLKKESDEAEKLGKYTKQTLNINQKIVQSGCKDTKYYLRLARCYVKFNNIDEAVDLYTSILRFSPDNEEAKDFLLFYGKGSIMNSKDPGKKKSMQYYKF